MCSVRDDVYHVKFFFFEERVRGGRDSFDRRNFKSLRGEEIKRNKKKVYVCWFLLARLLKDGKRGRRDVFKKYKWEGERERKKDKEGIGAGVGEGGREKEKKKKLNKRENRIKEKRRNGVWKG